MAERPLSTDPGAWGLALAVTLVGWLGAGAGYLNGDAAAYAAQAWQGDLLQRTVHLGWIALGAALAPLAGDALPLWLDRVVALSAGALVLGVGAMAGRAGRAPWAAAAVVAVAVLPWAAFGEVDLPWLALIAWAAAVPSNRVAGGLTALAVALSPAALLAVPWAIAYRRALAVDDLRHTLGEGDLIERTMQATRPQRLLWWGALGAVVLLTVISMGDWWTGPRGVLEAPSPRPLRALQAWVEHAIPWFSLPLVLLGWVIAGAAGLIVGLLMLLVPPDLPSGIPVAASLGIAAAATVPWLLDRERPGWARWVLVALAALVGADLYRATTDLAERRARVAAEDAVLRATVAEMGADDGLLARWTWGARASVIATGAVYELPWRVPGDPVRDPSAWCNRDFDRVFLLPVDATLPGDLAERVVRRDGLAWLPGDAEARLDLPGCE